MCAALDLSVSELGGRLGRAQQGLLSGTHTLRANRLTKIQDGRKAHEAIARVAQALAGSCQTFVHFSSVVVYIFLCMFFELGCILQCQSPSNAHSTVCS